MDMLDKDGKVIGDLVLPESPKHLVSTTVKARIGTIGILDDGLKLRDIIAFAKVIERNDVVVPRALVMECLRPNPPSPAFLIDEFVKRRPSCLDHLVIDETFDIYEYIHMPETKMRRRKGRRCTDRAVRHYHIKPRRYLDCFPSSIAAMDPCDPNDIIQQTINMQYDPVTEHRI